MRLAKNQRSAIPVPHGLCLGLHRTPRQDNIAPKPKFRIQIQNRNSNSISEFNFNGPLWIGAKNFYQAKVQATLWNVQSTEWWYAGDQERMLQAAGDLFVVLLPGWELNWRMLRLFELTGARAWMYVFQRNFGQTDVA